MTQQIFISYRHSQIELARELEVGFKEKGIQVFRDEAQTELFESISEAVTTGLANSHAMLLLLSEDYSTSRYCQWELTAAYIAAQQLAAPETRIFMVNIAGNVELLKNLPIELQDARNALGIENAIENGIERIIEQIIERLPEIENTFGDAGYHKNGKSYGRALTGSPRFAGREQEMWQLHSYLQGSKKVMITGHTGPDIAQVSGMGGIGKTLLAEEYALRFSAAYPGGIFWLDAYGSFNPNQPEIETFKAACLEQHIKIAYSLGLDPPHNAPLESLQASIRTSISHNTLPCLWVVDDIPSGLAKHLNEIKNWFSPCPALAPTLVTTRSKEYNSIGEELALDLLDESAALQLLRNNKIAISTVEDNAAAKELIKRLGGHALALDIAGAAIYQEGISIQQYLDELGSNMQELINIPSEIVAALPTGCDINIVRSMKRSIEKLKATSLDFLRLAANLAPTPIRQDLIEMIYSDCDQLDEKASKKNTRLSVLGCFQLNLANKNNAAWRVHALVAATIHFLNESEGARGKQLRQSAIKVLSGLIRYDLDAKATQEIAQEVEHARYLTENLTDEHELALMKRLGDFDHYRGYTGLAEKDWWKILAYNEKTLGLQHPSTLTSMSNLALTLWGMGELEGAKALQIQVIDLRKDILGERHLDTLVSMNNLAMTLIDMGDLEGAKALEIQVFEQRKDILGESHSATLNSMNNLASILKDMGELEGAKALEIQVLELRKDIQSERQRDTIISMGNLASTLQDMGDFEGAEALQTQVLELHEALLGERHPSTTTSAWNLFLTLHQLKQQKASEILFTEHLQWLLQSNLELPSAVHQQIRDGLREMFEN